MKNIFIPIILLVFTMHSYAQTEPQCGELPNAVGLSGVQQKEFNPSLFMPDLWGNPELLGDRRVFFIHGLGGQGDDDGSVGISWSQASYYSDFTYMINSARPDYADVSLVGAADELKGDLETFDDADEHAFIIAHSQGGIVSRQVDYYYSTGMLGTEPRTFGGLVTFGSPHQGAMILNNRDDLMNLLGSGCDALTSGPINEAIADNFWFDLLLDHTINQSTFEEFFCNTFEYNIAPYLFKDYYSGITESYMVGSPQLAIINAFTPEIPYICFYGVETEPIMWNTLVHALPDHEPNNTLTYGFEPFGSTDDTSLVHYIRKYTENYYAKYITYEMLADFEDAIGGALPGVLFTIDGLDAPELRDDYLQGYLWLTTANSAWRGIIGADEYEETSWTCMCDDEHDMDLTTSYYTVEPGESCDTEWGDCITTINYTLVQKESDGIVLKESAGECLGQLSEKPNYTREMDGSNHFSMRNDINTKNKLTELYQGHHGLFFYTHLR